MPMDQANFLDLHNAATGHVVAPKQEFSEVRDPNRYIAASGLLCCPRPGEMCLASLPCLAMTPCFNMPSEYGQLLWVGWRPNQQQVASIWSAQPRDGNRHCCCCHVRSRWSKPRDRSSDRLGQFRPANSQIQAARNRRHRIEASQCAVVGQ